MAAKITYAVGFEGLDENLIKLRELQRLLNSTCASTGRGININSGTSKGSSNIVVPSGASKGTGIVTAGEAFIAGSNLKVAASLNKNAQEIDKLITVFRELPAEKKQALASSQNVIEPTFLNQLSAAAGQNAKKIAGTITPVPAGSGETLSAAKARREKDLYNGDIDALMKAGMSKEQAHTHVHDQLGFLSAIRAKKEAMAMGTSATAKVPWDAARVAQAKADIERMLKEFHDWQLDIGRIFKNKVVPLGKELPRMPERNQVVPLAAGPGVGTAGGGFWTQLKNLLPSLSFSNAGGKFGMNVKNFKMPSKEQIHAVGRAAGLGREQIGLINKFAKLGTVAVALAAGFIAVRFAIKEMVEAIKYGAEALQKSARQGISTKTSSNLDEAFKQLGMATPDLSAVQQQLGKGNDADVIINNAKAGVFGKEDSQQIVNMATQFKDAMNDGKQDAREMALSANAAQILSMDGLSIAREFKTLWLQLVHILEPVIHTLAVIVEYILKTVNLILEASIRFGTWVQHLLGINLEANEEGGVNNHITGAGNGALNSQNGEWEKIGFNLPGAHQNNLKNIENNTAQIARGINTLIQITRGGSQYHGGGGFGGEFPTLPNYAH